jgi:hypothetical protein
VKFPPRAVFNRAKPWEMVGAGQKDRQAGPHIRKPKSPWLLLA